MCERCKLLCLWHNQEKFLGLKHYVILLLSEGTPEMPKLFLQGKKELKKWWKMRAEDFF